jgi:predicted RNA-binding protein with RPS1 domain
VGRLVAAEVSRVAPFGAFVRVLEPQAGEWLVSAVEGLVHRSECALAADAHLRQVLPRGLRLCLRVLAVDVERERLSLSRVDASGRILDWLQVEEIPERLEQERLALRQREQRQRAAAELAAENTAVIDGSVAFQRADPWKLRLCAALQSANGGTDAAPGPAQQPPAPRAVGGR